MPQLDATLGEDLGRLVIDQVALIVHDLSYTDLGDLDAACQTGTCVAVEDSAAADTVTACFEQGILFSVKTEARGEARASLCSIIATRAWRRSAHKVKRSVSCTHTSALVAVGHAAWRAIVSSAYHALLPNYAATNSPLHAVAPQCCQVGQLHEVLVPTWTQAGFVGEIEGAYGSAQRVYRSGAVEKVELCSVGQSTQACVWSKLMVIVLGDKVEDGRRSSIVCRAAIMVPLPPHFDGGIDTDK